MHNALREYISLHSRSLAVILLFHWFELKKLVSVEDSPSGPLRSAQGGKISILACLWFQVWWKINLIEPRLKNQVTETHLPSHQRAMNDNLYTFDSCASGTSVDSFHKTLTSCFFFLRNKPSEYIMTTHGRWLITYIDSVAEKLCLNQRDIGYSKSCF